MEARTGHELLFDSYLIVDWSGAGSPRTGADSIWIHLLGRRGGKLERLALDNPATRHSATALLRSWLQQLVGERRRVLVGFDFPLGYPRGLAERLDLAGAPWRAMWDHLGLQLRDERDNANNRFAVAAEMNRRLSGAPFPFWGCPPQAAGDYLAPKRHRRHGAADLKERRAVERIATSAQTCWKLYTTGSVGSQALTGIPRVRMLRDDSDLAPVTKVWPFETGLAVPDRSVMVTLAEVYPSLVPPAVMPGYPKDARQVVALARYFAELDALDDLHRFFTAGPEIQAERAAVEREEGWILGVTEQRPAVAPKPGYLRDADKIEQAALAEIRRVADFDGLPFDLRPVALKLIQTAGDPTVIEGLACSPGAPDRVREALAGDAHLLVDSEMLGAGITAPGLALDGRVICTMNRPEVEALSERLETTRAAASVELWRPHMGGAVIAIGNQATALFHLLEMLAAGAPKPAAVIGFPVGFVGATEAKLALMAQHDVPWISLAGRRGGSALAACVIDALAAPQA